MKKSLVKYSKFLSLILRHNPTAGGLELDEQGWADVSRVLATCASRGFPGEIDTQREVVATNDKQRFAFSPDGTKIRALQGHSIAVDLGLVASRENARGISNPQTVHRGITYIVPRIDNTDVTLYQIRTHKPNCRKMEEASLSAGSQQFRSIHRNFLR